MENIVRTEARVLLAKEVLRLVDEGFLRPAWGSLLSLPAGVSVRMDGNIRLRTLVLQQDYCRVCARGALNVTLLLQQQDDAMTWDSWRSTDAYKHYAEPLFSKVELRELEVAFEYWGSTNYPIPPADGLGTTADARLRGVMQSIIDNGRFTPPQWQLEAQSKRGY